MGALRHDAAGLERKDPAFREGQIDRQIDTYF